MLCALLAGGLTLGSTALHAQEAQTVLTYDDNAPVSSVEALVDGDYVLEFYTANANATGLAYYTATGSDEYRIDLTNPFAGGIITDKHYVWTLKWNEEKNAFSLQNKAADDVYFPLGSKVPNGRNNLVNRDGTAFYAPVMISDGSDGFYFKLTNPRNDELLTSEGVAFYLFSNNGSSDYRVISYFESSNPDPTSAIAQVKLYPVTEQTSVNITYNYMYDGVEKASETFNCVIGLPLPTPTYNFPEYVSAEAPEGNATEGVTEYNINCTLAENFPFTASESYDNAQWYALGLHNNPYYLHDNESADNITLGNEQTSLDASDLTTFNKSLWCFVGNPFDGFKIYNKNAGSTKILSSSTTMSGADGGSTFPIMTEEGSLPEGNNTTWDITPSGHIANGFYIAQHGISSNKMNLRENKLAYWSRGADNGSTFRVYDMQVLYEAKIAPMVSATETHPGYVGVLKSEVISNNQEAIDALAGGKGTPEQYVTLYNAVNGENSQLELTDGYYRIKCAPVRGDLNLSLDATNNRLSCATPSETDASQIWKIAATGDGLYTLTAQGVAPVKVAGGTTPVSYTEVGSETATTFYVKKGNVNDSQGTEGLMWFFDTTTGDINNNQQTALNFNGGNVILMPNDYGASVWYIQKAETIGLTIGGALCGTFCYDFAVELPEGLTAYRAVSDDASAIYLESIEERVVPANTPVLVQAKDAKTYELTILSDVAALSETNAFRGTLLPKDIDAGVNAYILGKKETDEAPRFYLVAEDDRTMPANKAYYVATGTQTQGFRLSFDGTTTGIDSAVTTEGGETEVYYDLSGRRVLYPAKGIYVKANGQKVYLK